MNREEKIVVALTSCSHAFSHGYQLIFPAVLLLLQKEFFLGYLELGIIGNIMTFAYGLGALPGGIIYNRIGPKRLYLICFVGSALALILVGVSPGVFLFSVGLALLGAIGSAYHPLANSLITSKVREYGRALGIHGATGNLGLAMTPFAAGLIGSQFGWRQAYLWFALSGIALSLWALFVDMSSGAEDTSSKPTSATRATPGGLKAYFSLPLLCLYLMNTLHSLCFFGSITFLPTYMAKRTSFHILSLDNVAIGGMLSGIVLLTGVIGQFMGGILSQKPHLERNFLFICIVSFPFMLAMSFFTNLLLLVLALLYYFFNFFLQPMNNTLLAQYTTVDMRGTAFGIFFFVAFCIGSLASSYSGFVAQQFGLQWVFLGLSLNALLLIFVALFFLNMKKSVDRP